MGIAFSMNRIAQESQERGVGAGKIRLFFLQKTFFQQHEPQWNKPCFNNSTLRMTNL